MAVAPAVNLWGIGVNPARYVFHAAHNEAVKGSFSVSNDHDTAMTVEIQASKGMDSGENEKIIRDAGWLKLSESAFELKPKETRAVEFTGEIPDGTAGTFSARVSFIDRSNNAFSSAVTVPIYVVIKGTEKVDWDTDTLLIENTPVGLSGRVDVKNRGNVHFYTSGAIVIKDKAGRECFKTQVGGGRAVFPNNVTQLPFNISALNIKNGKYYVSVALSGYNGENREFRYILIKKDEQYKIRKD